MDTAKLEKSIRIAERLTQKSLELTRVMGILALIVERTDEDGQVTISIDKTVVKVPDNKLSSVFEAQKTALEADIDALTAKFDTA